MSASHHGSSPEDKRKQEETMRRFLEQVDGRAKRVYSEGRMNEDDDGDIAFAIAADKKRGIVVLDFGKNVSWVGLPPQKVVELCGLLMKKAREVSTEPLVLEV